MPIDLAIIYGAGLGIFGVAYLFTRILCPPQRDHDESGGRKRSMSFSSSTLIEGSFPETATVAAPIINMLLLFQECPSEIELQDICDGLRTYDRFKCSVRKIGKEWFFVDSDVDPREHLVTHKIDSEQEMLNQCDRLCNEEFNDIDKKPLWMMHRFVNSGTGLSGVLVRVHHVIGDGISLVGAMGKLFRNQSGEPLQMDIPEKMRGGTGSETNNLSFYWKILKSFLEVASLATSARDSDIAFTSKDKPNLAMHGNRHKTVMMPNLKLDFVKELKNKAAVTVNDVLMATIAGTVRRYCEYRGDTTLGDAVVSGKGGTSIQCRALLPVAFPRSKEVMEDTSKAMRNLWSFVSAPLPVAEGCSAHDRLSAVHAFTTEMKKSPTALVQLWVQNHVLCLLPTFAVRKTAHDVFSRHSMVFSNVPGPPEAVSFGGQKMVGLQVMFPNILPQVMIVSYGGGVFFNMNVDVDDVSEPEKLAEFFLAEVTELAEHYGVDTSPVHMLSPRSTGGTFSTIPSV